MIKLKAQGIFSYLKEVTIVVIGVLIAVSIGNYKENLENNRYVRKTLLAIEKEINYSKEDIEDVLSRHYNLADSIATSMENEEESLAEVIARSGGIQYAETKNIGLRFFVSNKADLVDFEIISQLSEIETTTLVLAKKMDRLLDVVHDIMDEKDAGSKKKFLILLANVVDSEESILVLYEDFLKENKGFLDQARDLSD